MSRFGKPMLVLGSMFLATVIVVAQQAKEHDEPSLKLSTDLVVVDAQILSKKTKRAIGELTKANFIVSENGLIQEITYFGHNNLPLSVILLVDKSGSVGSILNEIHTASIQALAHLKPEDKVALMVFDSVAWLVQDFTTDKHLIAQRLRYGEDGRWDITPAPGWENIDLSLSYDGTIFSDSIYEAAVHLQGASDPAGRRAIIVVTDNYVYAPRIRHSVTEVVNQLSESGVTVYGLALDSFLAKLSKYTLMGLGADLLSRKGGNVNTYADKTGGVVLKAKHGEAVAKLTEIVNLLRLRYSFGYAPTNQQMDGKFRKIKLRVTSEVEKREGGVIILTRQGYYARRRDSAVKPAQEKPPAPKND